MRAPAALPRWWGAPGSTCASAPLPRLRCCSPWLRRYHHASAGTGVPLQQHRLGHNLWHNLLESAVFPPPQSGLLAQRDSWTPCLLVCLTGALNVAGDVYLIGARGMGLAGAAWATVLSQWVGAACLAVALQRKAVRARGLLSSAPRLQRAVSRHSRGRLRDSPEGLAARHGAPAHGRVRCAQVVPRLVLRVKSLRAICATFGPATLLYLAKMCAYLLVQVRAGHRHPRTAALPPCLLSVRASSVRDHRALNSWGGTTPCVLLPCVQGSAMTMPALQLAAHQPVWAVWSTVRRPASRLAPLVWPPSLRASAPYSSHSPHSSHSPPYSAHSPPIRYFLIMS